MSDTQKIAAARRAFLDADQAATVANATARKAEIEKTDPEPPKAD